MIDEAGFLASIVASPDDDLPRLIYADFLEEHGRPVECPECEGYKRVAGIPGRTLSEKCRRCGGSGSINPDAEHAELIRIEVELARLPPAAWNVRLEAVLPGDRFEVTSDRPLVAGESVRAVFDCGAGHYEGLVVISTRDFISVNGLARHTGVCGPGGRMDADRERREALRRRRHELIQHAMAWVPVRGTPTSNVGVCDCRPDDRTVPGGAAHATYYFRRGFPTEIACSWDWFAANANAILTAAPIRERAVETVCRCCSGEGCAQHGHGDPTRVCNGDGKGPPRYEAGTGGVVRLADWPTWRHPGTPTAVIGMTADDVLGRLAAEYPGVRFELPSAPAIPFDGTAQSVTIDAPFCGTVGGQVFWQCGDASGVARVTAYDPATNTVTLEGPASDDLGDVLPCAGLPCGGPPATMHCELSPHPAYDDRPSCRAGRFVMRNGRAVWEGPSSAPAVSPPRSAGSTAAPRRPGNGGSRGARRARP